ncbi:uncharacterized protein B0J16DRAFT_69261 [Fusarium flagelliforme]|uniref:uncharacterized protein n=1 Tax=Fusarium flagelliforme TaxID=2675880 RepID=UPI001E8D07C2|nr:uncharacterized protein B0J16DRAFT_69261 [Fusarium flagelliforme]KAH7193015.1 hypothetical protein B0J16DRAFT_69261 [Fusarium flagelliforme]
MTGRVNSPPRRLRACASCARVKARCHFREENQTTHICDRCEALEKECLPQTTSNLRKPRRIDQSREDTAQSQGLLSALNKNVDGLSNIQQIKDPEKIPEDIQNTNSNLPTVSQPLFGFSWPQVSQILDLFRKEYIPRFPFVLISSHQTAQSLYKDNPFLFRAVMLVVAPVSEIRICKMKRNVLAYLGYRTLVEEDMTLDILQGILVIIAWAHKCHVDNSQVVNLAYLALGYAHNLGITQDTSLSSTQQSDPKLPDTERVNRKEDPYSTEKKRTLLGLYCVLSIQSARQSRANPLQTPYIDNCLKTIAQAQPSPSDSVAEHIVRLIQMSERLSEGFGEPHERTLSRPYAFLLEGTGRRFHSDLSRLSESIAYPNLSNHSQTFEMHRLYLLVRLYEPAIVVSCHPEDGVSQFVYLLICLRNCLEAMQSFFDIFLGLPVDMILRCSIVTVDQVLFVMLQASRLLLVDVPDWDVQSARQTLDFSAILNRMLAHFEEAEELRRSEMRIFAAFTHEEDRQGGISNIARIAKEIQWLKAWFEAKTHGRHVEAISLVELGGDASEDQITPKWSVGLLEEMPWNIVSP